MTPLRRAGGWALGVLGTVVIVGLSQVPYAVSPSDHAELRFAWRYRSASIDRCRPPTEEENAALPAHMRQTEICERQLQPWRLGIWIDDVPIADDTVRARGAREDRPLYVFRNVPLSPGVHQLRAVFSPVGPSERPPLVLEATVELGPRQVGLVTYDSDTDRLALRYGIQP